MDSRETLAKEREARLDAARKKLKTYRARQPKNDSTSSIASSTNLSQSKRSSLISTSGQSFSEPSSSKHMHRKSNSRGFAPQSVVGNGHAKNGSKSRASIGHSHSRSKASVSLSASGNAANFPPSPLANKFEPGPTSAPLQTRLEGNSKTSLGAPASWSMNGSTSFPHSQPTSVNYPSSAFDNLSSTQSAANALFEEAINHATRAALPSHASNRSMSNSISHAANSSLSKSSHARKASRHGRQSSVSNFRESIEIMSGAGQFLGGLQPGVSSFAATDGASNRSTSPLAPTTPSEGSPTATWSNDPAKVLEILKERGRRESAAEKDPVRTRQGALEALEGRVAAPSEMIDLGGLEEETELDSPIATFSPMIGLGLGSTTSKRSSWNMQILSAGAKGAMDLGMLVEEEEEDEDIPNRKSLSPRPKRRSAQRKRPSSLAIPAAEETDRIVISDSPTSILPPRPMRTLSMSSSVTLDTPSSTIQRAAALRSLTLGASPVSPEFTSALPTSTEKRRHSLFHGSAAAIANAKVSPESANNSTPPPATRGLRSLSIGGLAFHPGPNVAASPDRERSPILGRQSSSTSTSAAYSGSGPRNTATKRSSISYRTSPIAALGSPEGPLSAGAQNTRRPWRGESLSSSVGAGPIPTSGTSPGYTFPFAPSHGNLGGFGDLEVAEEEEGLQSPSNRNFIYSAPSQPSEDSKAMALQLAILRNQVESLQSQAISTASVHALEIAEIEKKAGEEAKGMRIRISEMDRSLEEARVVRRFEVEGLTREVEQAREAVQDLRDERDSLIEDVEGWRERCATLEQSAKKDREDEALAKAQAKLSGEMRDQIYNLVAALERERAEHDLTSQELERLLVENASLPPQDESDDEEAAIGARGHSFQNASDDSFPSISSYAPSFSGNNTDSTATEYDDSKMSSPTSGHSFVGSKGRDSDFGGASGLGGLHTLAEEDEEEELSSEQQEEERNRLGSGSTGSTDNSDPMPMTPNTEAVPHNRSDSFVRHWSFPKGSVTSVRISGDDHSFFDLGRHNSLPALPIADTILPAFLGADLTVDEDLYETEPAPAYAPQHIRRPSSPRPMERINPHARRFSGQYAAKAPPISPSALAHAALQSSISSVGSLSSSIGRASPTSRIGSGLARLSFGNLSNLLGYSTSSSNGPISPGATQSRMTTPREEEESYGSEDVFHSSPSTHRTPPSSNHSQRFNTRLAVYIKAKDQPIPRGSKKGLDFNTACCGNDQVHYV